MPYVYRALRLLPILLLSVVLVGCDSGGSEDPLDGTLTYTVEGGNVTVTLTESYFYGECQATRTSTREVPIEGELGIEEVSCEGVDPSNFDGVRVRVTLQSGSEDLTLQLLSDGEVVDEDSEGEVLWTVEVGEISSAAPQ